MHNFSILIKRYFLSRKFDIKVAPTILTWNRVKLSIVIVLGCMRSQSRSFISQSPKFYRSFLTQYRASTFQLWSLFQSRETCPLMNSPSLIREIFRRRSKSHSGELVEGDTRFRDSVLALRKIGFQFFWLSNCAKKERRIPRGVRDPVDFVFEMPDRRNCVRDLRDRPSNGERRRRILSDTTRPDRFPGSHLRS